MGIGGSSFELDTSEAVVAMLNRSSRVKAVALAMRIPRKTKLQVWLVLGVVGHACGWRKKASNGMNGVRINVHQPKKPSEGKG